MRDPDKEFYMFIGERNEDRVKEKMVMMEKPVEFDLYLEA